MSVYAGAAIQSVKDVMWWFLDIERLRAELANNTAAANSNTIRYIMFFTTFMACVIYLLAPLVKSNNKKAALQRSIWISIEANIAAGKSTLIQRVFPMLQTEYGKENVVHVPEPLEAWEKSDLLRLSYERPTEYLFAAQCEFFRTRIDAFIRAYDPEAPRIYISERSPFSDKIFVNTQVALGRFDPLLYMTYMGLWSHFQRLLPLPQPDAFVYLKPSLDACMDRLRERARSSETTVDTVYQGALRQAHDAEFANDSSTGFVTMPNGTRVPCEVIETNDNFRDSPKHAEKMASRLIALINKVNA